MSPRLIKTFQNGIPKITFFKVDYFWFKSQKSLRKPLYFLLQFSLILDFAVNQELIEKCFSLLALNFYVEPGLHQNLFR